MSAAEECAYALCDFLSEAYIYHAISIHRRPIYRHECGDIGLNRRFLTGLIENHLAERFSPEKRFRMYQRLFAPERDCSDQMFCMGRVPELNARGIRFMNLAVKGFADGMINTDARQEQGKLIIPDNAEVCEDYESRILH